MTYKELMLLLRDIIPNEYLKLNGCSDKSILYELINETNQIEREKVATHSDASFRSYVAASEARSIRSFAREISQHCSIDAFYRFLEKIDNDPKYDGDISRKIVSIFEGKIDGITELSATEMLAREFCKTISYEATRPARRQRETNSEEIEEIDATPEFMTFDEEVQYYFDKNPDASSVIDNIKLHHDLYVETNAYRKALSKITKLGRLLILGEPGVGKTIVSEMICLEFLRNDYGVRCALRGESISELDERIRMDKDRKELIYIDDCLGQAYFDLTAPHETKLKSLISYVFNCKNKVLLLNSRITVYNSALRIDTPLGQTFNGMSDNNAIYAIENYSKIEKARIFYIHLLNKKSITPEHYRSLRRKSSYLRIIEHPNYLPRIMEFVTTKSFVKNFVPNLYSSKVLEVLDDPKAAWDDEYKNNIGIKEQLLLTTIYSLTDKQIDINLCRKAYLRRIENESEIVDKQGAFEESIELLSDSMVSQTVSFNYDLKKEIRKIGVSNPSINDYLGKRIMTEGSSDLVNTQNCIVANAQIYRLYNKSSLTSVYKKKLKDRSILDLIYENEADKTFEIVQRITQTNVKDEAYIPYVKKFIDSPERLKRTLRIFSSDFDCFLALVKNVELYDFYYGKELPGQALEFFFSKLDIPQLFNFFKVVKYNNPQSFDISDKQNAELIELAKEKAAENSAYNGFDYVDEFVIENINETEESIFNFITNRIREDWEMAVSGSEPIMVLSDMKDRLQKHIDNYGEEIKDSISEAMDRLTEIEDEEEESDEEDDMNEIKRLFEQVNFKVEEIEF